MILFRIGRFGIVMSKVPSCVPMIGSRSFPARGRSGRSPTRSCANSNWRTRLAQPDERGDAPLHAVLGRVLRQGRAVGPPAPDHLAAFMFCAVSRGFMRRMCAPSGHA